ncbi:MAG: hypothetical protein LUG52_00315, partial [Clostridia bacterium]|nr:hypothetical protein [Clostridia bacterium]
DFKPSTALPGSGDAVQIILYVYQTATTKRGGAVDGLKRVGNGSLNPWGKAEFVPLFSRGAAELLLHVNCQSKYRRFDRNVRHFI